MSRQKKFDLQPSKYYIYYVIWAVVAALVVSWVFSAIRNKNDDRVKVFICAYGVDESLGERLTADGKTPIIYVHSSEETYYYLTLQTKGLNESDLLILPESQLTFERVTQAFTPLDSVGLDYAAVTYAVDGVAYGVKVYDKEKKTGCLTDVITYLKQGEPEQDYYLFFNGNTVGGDGRGGTLVNAAAAVARIIIG